MCVCDFLVLKLFWFDSVLFVMFNKFSVLHNSINGKCLYFSRTKKGRVNRWCVNGLPGRNLGRIVYILPAPY